MILICQRHAFFYWLSQIHWSSRLGHWHISTLFHHTIHIHQTIRMYCQLASTQATRSSVLFIIYYSSMFNGMQTNWTKFLTTYSILQLVCSNLCLVVGNDVHRKKIDEFHIMYMWLPIKKNHLKTLEKRVLEWHWERKQWKKNLCIRRKKVCMNNQIRQ